MKQLKTLTIEEIRERSLKAYYKAFLMDEIGLFVSDLVGRFETLEEAEKECRRWSREEIDGESEYMIIKYAINNKGEYIKKTIIRY